MILKRIFERMDKNEQTYRKEASGHLFSAAGDCSARRAFLRIPLLYGYLRQLPEKERTGKISELKTPEPTGSGVFSIMFLPHAKNHLSFTVISGKII